MVKRITFPEAEKLLRSREELLLSGLTERGLATAVDAGGLLRVHRGWYVAADDWADLWSEGRQLLRVIALARSTPGAGPVFVRESAAVLWGLPLYRQDSALTHTLIRGRRHARTVSGVARHDLDIDESDIVERHGLLCTSLVRTVFDMSRVMSLEASVSAADAALAQVAVQRHRQIEERAAQWRDDFRMRERAGLRGIRQARWVAEFADGRAQLPGESVSRLQLFRLGFRDVELQVPISGADGDQYFLDFGFRRSRRFGEFDGEGKYLENGMLREHTPARVVFAEKHREDDVRGVTGWGFARWGGKHILTPEVLGARLARFGIRPPG
ncbi:hypothetical protein [Microbacterium sp.]|uniref:hypothetical protein n=1 Tax=Microbacterium sp. TaxID=51671 RepID=UPI0039E722E2